MNQRELFDADRTVATACPVGHCQAIRLPDQDRVVTCTYDLWRQTQHRPKRCLNRHDPAVAPFPEGY